MRFVVFNVLIPLVCLLVTNSFSQFQDRSKSSQSTQSKVNQQRKPHYYYLILFIYYVFIVFLFYFIFILFYFIFTTEIKVGDDYWRNVDLEEQRRILDDYQDRISPSIRTLRGNKHNTKHKINISPFFNLFFFFKKKKKKKHR